MCTIHDALNSYCIYDNVEFHRHNEMFFPSFQEAALNTDLKVNLCEKVAFLRMVDLHPC